MSLEFVDTNIFVYSQDRNAPDRQVSAAELLARLTEEGNGAISTQVLTEFYSAATGKLAIPSQVAEDFINALSDWRLHRLSHSDVIRAAQLHRRYKTSWWDALILNSALELGCTVLWTEDFRHGQKFGSLTIRNPFV